MVGAKDDDFSGAIKKLPVIPAGNAFKVQANVDFNDEGVKRVAGEEWQVWLGNFLNSCCSFCSISPVSTKNTRECKSKVIT